MTRKFSILVALTAMLISVDAAALGIGDIDIRSRLNERLNAEIFVLSATEGEIEDMSVKLAGRAAFLRAGIERPYHLSQLRFKVTTTKGGKSIIRVTTRDLVREPFLNFIVEVNWPRGKLLREYTILLDPPVTMAAKSAPRVSMAPTAKPTPAPFTKAAPPQEAASEGGLFPRIFVTEETSTLVEAPSEAELFPRTAPESELFPRTAPEDELFPRAPIPEAPSPSFSGDQYGPTGEHETLWSIATKTRPDRSVSVHQMMLALLRANPEAFANGNINNLKRGSILRIPGRAVSTSLTKQAALAEVSSQNATWQAGRGVSVTTAPRVVKPVKPQKVKTPAAKETMTQDRLALLSPDKGAASGAPGGTGAADKAKTARVKRELTLANESLASQRMENQELKSRVQQLEAMVAEMKKLKSQLSVQDQELARLQQKLRGEAAAAEKAVQEKAAAEQAAQTAKAQAAAAVLAAQDKAAAEQATAEKAAAERVAAVEQAAQEKAAAEQAAAEQAAQEKAAQEQAATAAQAAQKQAVAEQPAVEQAPADQAVPEKDLVSKAPGMVDKVIAIAKENMMIVAGGAGVILLALVGVWFMRKRGAEAEEAAGDTIRFEEEVEEEEVEEDITDRHPAEAAEEEAGPTEIREEAAPAAAAPAVAAVPEAEEEEAEDKTLIAPPPASAEEAAEEDDPVLGEVDVYTAFGDYDQAAAVIKGALAEAPERVDYILKLIEIHRDNDDAGALEAAAEQYQETLKASGDWDIAVEMGKAVAPNSALFGGGGGEPSLDTAGMEALPESEPTQAIPDEGADEDLDFDLDLGAEEETAAPEMDALDQQAGDDLADTTVFLAEPAIAEAPAEPTEPAAEEDAGGLDFDLELGGEEAPAETIEAAAEEDAGGLDFDLELGGEEAPAETVEAAVEEDAGGLDFDLELGGEEAEVDLEAPTEKLDAEAVAAVRVEIEETESAASGEEDEFSLDLGDLDAEGVDVSVEEAPADDSTTVLLEEDDAGGLMDLDLSESDVADEVGGDIDEVGTKLDLARAYIDMGDADGARGILAEVIAEGNDAQKKEAEELQQNIA
ncbi:MAG: hypothetical protein BMS9Abin15_0202 [Gammaproteobacteria bacterium]|nr:MAG: hypothetical protein BMS9Abin15_0202 [Gammaproteobacteria bacterium]